MSEHVLDRPVWSALTTRQASFAIGSERALRFDPEIGPFAATRDDDPESLEALQALAPEEGTLLFLQADPIALPPGLVPTMTADGVQMILEELGTARSIDAKIEKLTDADAADMLELATSTKPGPFARRTSSLGEFWGVRENGVLLAMAGTRMQQPGFTEVSGVCTHPDARGRGFARALSALVTAQILERGDTPYLHAYAANTTALELYRSLGFRLRCGVHVAMVSRQRIS